MPISRIELRLPAAMMNAWTPTTATGRRRAAGSRRGRGDAQAALDDHDEAEDGEDARQAELLAEGGEQEVGLDLRDRQPAADKQQAHPEPRPDDAAAGGAP